MNLHYKTAKIGDVEHVVALLSGGDFGNPEAQDKIAQALRMGLKITSVHFVDIRRGMREYSTPAGSPPVDVGQLNRLLPGDPRHWPTYEMELC